MRAMNDSLSNSRRFCASSTAPPTCGRLQRYMTDDGFSFTPKFAKRHLKYHGRLPAPLPGLTAQQRDAESESDGSAERVPPGSPSPGADSSLSSLSLLAVQCPSNDPSQDATAPPDQPRLSDCAGSSTPAAFPPAAPCAGLGAASDTL